MNSKRKLNIRHIRMSVYVKLSLCVIQWHMSNLLFNLYIYLQLAHTQCQHTTLYP